MTKLKTLRFTFCNLENDCMIGDTTSGRLSIACTPEQQQHTATFTSLHKGAVFNLLNVEIHKNDSVTAEFLIYEPDWLLDISALAECFRPYGHHPLNHTLSRLSERETSVSILLGNTANFFLDAIVNEDDRNPADCDQALRDMFRTSAFEFTACEDLKKPSAEKKFFADCRRHFENIRYAVGEFFQKAGIDRHNATLEPSFICNALGLQGRLDLMLSDFTAFVELKSGKAVEDFRTGGQFICAAENHYVQMLLYLATLEFNLGLDPDSIRSFLLYSKYPILSRERHSRKILAEALCLRNLIVDRDNALQQANSTAATLDALSEITPDRLNTAQMTGKLFDNYLAPTIDRFAVGLSSLDDCEKQYFLRLYNFILKELWLSKAGEREYEGVRRAATLWNAPTAEKISAGELLYDLTVTCNRAAEEDHTVELSIPKYPDLYLPNFRQGDAAILYERQTDADTPCNRQVFRGTIEKINADTLTFRLRYRQKNRQVWTPQATCAIEHDYMDITFTSMFRSLSAFIHANKDRKRLLTLPPDPSGDVSLLIGPPGTGKTSIALKRMVEDELARPNTAILLLAYTNRAVDEICRALSSIDSQPQFIRVGSELNCSPEFRHALIENLLAGCSSRREVATAIARCRIFVGTAASVGSRPELFRLRHFDLCIVDEATQLLEPHLLSIICARNPDDRNAIDRFTLIGDHKQLPAIVLQSREDSRVVEPALVNAGIVNLADSLFERLYRSFAQYGLDNRFSMLTRQGRMHPEIAAFPSEHFYGSQLLCVGLPHQTETSADNRVGFYDVRPSGKDFSDKANANEARRVQEICINLYQECQEAEKHFDPATIGVITPFRSQIALIRQMLQESGVAPLADIMVDTVERFQGSQRDVIIYSFCIKTKAQLNALPNLTEENGRPIDRKLNVALTRARQRLFLVGNRKLLKCNEIYARLIDFVEKKQ